MKAFCCDNYKDESVLQGLMSRFYPKGNRPQIIVSPFSDKLYNVHGRLPNRAGHDHSNNSSHHQLPAVCFRFSAFWLTMRVDVWFQEKDKARRIMQKGRPPKNCREAFTAEGDQVFPNRYYTSEFSMAKYLKLENLKAQLSRFHLQANSVTEDILSMENILNSTIKTLKKTQQISPERQHVTCSTKSIDTEITRLKKKLKVYESNHGEQEQVIRKQTATSKWVIWELADQSGPTQSTLSGAMPTGWDEITFVTKFP
ncbi:hypothetical protein GOODEAATRI_010698 [Goodea atripinnis]|uniref:Uncharacterized protein n=1 Tax=Goodea atripinnis TaxID=208336 RepID=A0ABV0PD06_9TELE